MLSVPDMAVIGALALIFFGPEQLPRVARQVGRVVRDVQNTSQSFIHEMERAADDMDVKDARAARPAEASAEPQPPDEPQPESHASTEAEPDAHAASEVEPEPELELDLEPHAEPHHPTPSNGGPARVY